MNGESEPVPIFGAGSRNLKPMRKGLWQVPLDDPSQSHEFSSSSDKSLRKSHTALNLLESLAGGTIAPRMFNQAVSGLSLNQEAV